MSYYKRIVYVDSYKDGVKVANVGFVRLLKREDTCLQIQVSNDACRERVWRDVKLQVGEKDVLLGKMELVAGKGFLQVEHLEKILEGAGADSKKQEGMELRMENPALDDIFLCKLVPERGVGFESIEESRAEAAQKAVAEEKSSGEDEDMNGTKKEAVSEQEPQEIVTAEAEDPPRAEPREEIKKLLPDKWRQISEIYPWIRPFRDERRYVQLGLSDLILLPKQYYRLVENSFLLHGYYNYGHLILARVCRRGLDKFYIGVPGNYYEKEKQVAVLFGFESFESEKESAEEGEFGYYMISVDI